MDEYIQNAIDTRRDTVMNYFSVPDERKAEVDAIFSGMEELGNTCKDVAEFEQRLAADPLNAKYMELFQTLKPSKAAVAGAVRDSYASRYSSKKNIAKDVADVVETEVIGRATQKARHEAYMEQEEFLRENVPGYLEAKTAANTAGMIGRLFGRRKKKDPEE